MTQANEFGRVPERQFNYKVTGEADRILIAVEEGEGALSFITIEQTDEGKVEVSLDLSDGEAHLETLGQPGGVTKL